MRPGNRTERRAKELYRTFSTGESAQDMVEYALVAALLGVGVILAWYYILSSSISTVFLNAAKALLMIL